MKSTTLELLACPVCQGKLDYCGSDTNTIQSGSLSCGKCHQTFNVNDGIPRFIESKQLSGLNRRLARAYDWFSWGYALFSKIAFAYIGMNEETGRREITDRLDPRGGRVLEVSIGPGVNLPYLVDRPDIGEIFGLDISLGQLQRCQSYIQRKHWGVELFLGNGECLPFQDNSFDGVFHVGGINFFNNKKAAINEMIRVAKPGARILIADETERGAQAYERFSPGFKSVFDGKRDAIIAPVDLVPQAMLETRVVNVWKDWLYCIEFRKPYG
jgi:ubiquinone/menaquinone biosynthesis C-methylase UbiE/uncharacterized protein YbaR (Trm112 family)